MKRYEIVEFVILAKDACKTWSFETFLLNHVVEKKYDLLESNAM
jgi:hypothetical protein